MKKYLPEFALFVNKKCHIVHRTLQWKNGLVLVLAFALNFNVFAQTQASSGYYTKETILKRLGQMGMCSSSAERFFNLFTSVSVPQQPKANVDSFKVGFNAQSIKTALSADGMQSDALPGYVNRLARAVYHGFQDDSSEQRYIAPPQVTPQTGCTNPGFETGDFTGWTGTTGCDTLDYTNASYSCTAGPTFTPGIVSGRQTIMSGTGTDPYGGFPVVNPNGGGSFSARLGNDQVGSQSEQLKYTFVVDASSKLFTYWYAVVLENPGGSHTNIQQPWFQVNMDAGGNDVPCGDYFVAGNNATGFSQTTITDPYGYSVTVMYKAWTPVTIDLSPYVGQTVTLTFTTSDCSLGGHFGYAYIDCSCDPEAILQNHKLCQFSPVQLSLPGFGSYNWSPNGETTSSITASSPGIYSVQTTTLTGCPGPTMYDTIVQYPNPTPGFSTTGNCASIVNFTDTSSVSGATITNWNWDFGDGNTSTSQNPTHTYSPPGSYTVQLVVTTSDGCKDSITENLGTPTPPTAQFTSNTVCQSNPTTLTDQSQGNGSTISSWNWNFGDPNSGANNTSTQQNPTHIFTTSGTYNVQLVITTAGGCQDSITNTVTVNAGPTAGFAVPDVCLGNTSSFTDQTQANGTTISGWNWSFGDGNTSTSQNPTNTYASAGTYNVQLIVSSNQGCIDTVNQTAVVDSLPVASFTGTNVCQGTGTDFADMSTPTGGVTWNWAFGDGTNSTVQNPIHTYNASGTYTAVLTVATGAGCQSIDSNTVTVYPNPTAAFTNTTVCLNNTTNFTDQSQNNGGQIVSWNWNFGETSSGTNNTSTQQNPVHTYASAGTFNVTLVVTDSSGCQDSIIQPVVVNPLPVVAFTSTNVCQGLPSDFVDQSSVSSGSVTGWNWTFGESSSGTNTSTAQNPSHIYAAAGTYTVVLTATSDQGCQTTDSNTVTVNPIPIPDFSSNVVCLNNPTNFTDLSQGNGSGIASWSWNFGEPSSGVNNSSSSQNPSHTYSAAGSYTVTLVVTNTSGCSDSISHTVYVNPLPVAQFTGTDVCQSGIVHTISMFSDQSTISGGSISNWSWNFGDPGSGPNNLSSSQNVSHSYSNPGVYPVILTVTSDSGCQSTITHNINVYPLPVASYTATTVCAGHATQFTDGSTVSSGSITTWDWNFGDNSQHGSVQNPVHTYTTNGTYVVTLIVTTDQGCQSTYVDSILVNPMPAPSFTATSVCLKNPTVFTDASTIPAPGTIAGWQWDFGDGSPVDNTQNPTHTYGAAGTYTVTLTVSSSLGCDSSYSIPVVVYPLPQANFTNTNVCDGTTTTFTDSSSVSSGSITNWSWDLGDGTTSGTENPTHLYTSPGNYSASLVVTTDYGCKDSITKPVSVYYNPVVAFSVDSPMGCAVHCVNLTDSSYVGGGDSLVNWQWDLGDGNFSNAQNPSHCYPDPGTYSVGLTVTSNHGCQASYIHPDMITVWPIPTAQFTMSPQPTTIMNPVIHFTDQSLDATYWHWSFGDGDTLGLTTENPIHSYEDTGRYTATLVVINQYGCRDTISHDVFIGPEFTFYIPNAFSPNGDGVNDYFYGKGIGIIKYQMWIFDRWGNMIFHGTSLNDKWDGKVQGGPSGQMVQEDVYVWLVKLEDVFHKQHRYIGHVSVIK